VQGRRIQAKRAHLRGAEGSAQHPAADILLVAGKAGKRVLSRQAQTGPQAQGRQGKTEAGRKGQARHVSARAGENVRPLAPIHPRDAQNPWDNQEKKQLAYLEASEKERARLASRVKRVPPGKRVCADESGIREHPQREFGHALRGQKIAGSKPGKRFARANVIGALCADCIFAWNATGTLPTRRSSRAGSRTGF